jgi:hypothetical protein
MLYVNYLLIIELVDELFQLLNTGLSVAFK